MRVIDALTRGEVAAAALKDFERVGAEFLGSVPIITAPDLYTRSSLLT